MLKNIKLINSLDMDPVLDVLKVNEQIRAKVAKKFKGSEGSLDDDVLVLQEWIKSQPHLPRLLDTHSLKNFLTLNKCSVEITKQKIDNYYTVRSKMPQIYRAINPKLPYSRGINDAIYMVVYPELTDDLCKLLYFKIKNENLQHKYEVADVIRKFLNLQELRLREDTMYGDIFIVDLQGLHPSTFLRISPAFVYKNLLQVYGKIFSLPVKGVYLINVPSFFSVLLDALKFFIKPKLIDRIQLNPDMATLTQKIPLRMIPKEFGGEGLSLDVLQDALETKYRQQQDLFDELDGIKIDENIRPGKLEDSDSLGFHGSFKRLEID